MLRTGIVRREGSANSPSSLQDIRATSMRYARKILYLLEDATSKQCWEGHASYEKYALSFASSWVLGPLLSGRAKSDFPDWGLPAWPCPDTSLYHVWSRVWLDTPDLGTGGCLTSTTDFSRMLYHAAYNQGKREKKGPLTTSDRSRRVPTLRIWALEHMTILRLQRKLVILVEDIMSSKTATEAQIYRAREMLKQYGTRSCFFFYFHVIIRLTGGISECTVWSQVYARNVYQGSQSHPIPYNTCSITTPAIIVILQYLWTRISWKNAQWSRDFACPTTLVKVTTTTS